MLASQILEEDEENDEMKEDRARLISLNKELDYKRRDLHSSLPRRNITHTLMNKPIVSDERVVARQDRKRRMAAMVRALNARDRNKYISSQANQEKTMGGKRGLDYDNYRGN